MDTMHTLLLQVVYYKNYRENVSVYRLDGLVIKHQCKDRLKLGENDHGPEWALAVKFPCCVNVAATV
jgi:NAD-dependent DNA ligase